MKASAVAVALLLLVTPLFAADPVPADKDKLVQQLERTRERFLKSVEGLSEAQWQYKASPEKWSIAQCAEHIAAAEGMILGAINASLSAPAAAPAENAVKDDLVLKAVVDRSNKFKAPEPLVPTNRFGAPKQAVDEFVKQRGETIKVARGDADLRNHSLQNPAVGLLDTYGWILFTSAHSERHTLQIEEVKADPGFPKN